MISFNKIAMNKIESKKSKPWLSVFLSIISIILILESNRFLPEALAINSVLDLNGTFPYLINNISGQIIEPRDYMDFENLYAPNETYKIKQTAQGRNYHLIKAFDFANYFQSDYWHYSSDEELRLSAQPVAEPVQCSRQLNWLEKYLNKSQEVLFKPGEQHINLMTLVDSFGHPETATYYGHGYWLGSYYECSRVSIDMQQFEQEEECFGISSMCRHAQQEKTIKTESKLKFRYCIGKAHDIDWPKPEQDNYVPRISYKVGLCLPETCETLSFERHSKQIERLMRLNMPEYTKGRIELHDMYCLPDSRSPIRSLSTSARIFLSICIAWLTILVIATAIYSCYKRHQQDIRKVLIAEQTTVHNCEASHQSPVMVENGNLINKKSTQHTNGSLGNCVILPNCCIEAENKCNNAIANSKLLLYVQTKPTTPDSSTAPVPLANTNTEFGPDQIGLNPINQSGISYRTSSTSTLSAWLDDSPIAIKILQALSIKETVIEFQQPPELLRKLGATKRLRINLNALDSIKCLCCVLVIFGHIIFIHMQHLSNIIHTIELSHELYPRVLIAFFNFVDTFFIISGMLTAYFIFKRFNKKTFSNPAMWIYVSLLRLLRLSPVYVLVFWFIKTLSVYISDGPIWDYGTDRQSIKGLCINDHWWKSILYLGNLGTVQPLCILPAWSIIVDAQYSLVVPPIIFLIFKCKRIGYLTLLIAVIVSTTKMSFQLANQTAVKTSDMAKIRLHVYPLISRFAAEFYNDAWNRIGPVAIGIVGGHVLYLYDIGTIRQWPWFMRGVSFKIVLFLHLFIFMLPAIGRFTDNPESSNDTDMTIFILSNATIKPIWSLINTIFLLRLITDLRSHSFLARLMSHNIWHCLGKLCFTSYLIHYEIILTLLKSRQEGLIDPNWSNALREFSTAFLTSTIVSYFIYILYEAPINKLISLAFAKRHNYLKKNSIQTMTTTKDMKQGEELLDSGQSRDTVDKRNSFDCRNHIDNNIHINDRANIEYSMIEGHQSNGSTNQFVGS